MRRLGLWLKAASSSPWPQVAARALAKLGIQLGFLNELELAAVARAADGAREAKIIERALGQAAGIGAPALWQAVAGAQVIEIGCGRLGGLGPACVAAGAERYIGVDPGVTPRLFRRARVVEQVVQPALAACAAHLGVEPVRADAQAFANRTEYLASDLEMLELATRANVALSISCLEHIGDIPAAIAALARLTAPDAMHAHLVNFGNHTDKGAPFAGLYDMPGDEYCRRWGYHINALRLPDILDAFTQAGIVARGLVLDARPDALPARLHPWWRERYDEEQLAVRTALIVSGLGPAGAP